MGTIREALLRNGVFLYNNLGEDLTIEDGFGQYMIARDRYGNTKYRIRAAELTNQIIVEDYASGREVQRINAYY